MISLIMFFLNTSATDIHNKNIVLPEMDKALITLWYAATNHCEEESWYALTDLKKVWNQNQDDFHFHQQNGLKLEEFKASVDHLIKIMERSEENGNYSNLASFAYELIWEFRAVRDCLEYDDYPLDQLWKVYDSYLEIHFVVNDIMFGKMEWFEFKDLLKDLERNWTGYKSIDNASITAWFEGFDTDLHTMSKNSFEECHQQFQTALNKSNTTHYVIPCDDMGAALNELILVYANDELIRSINMPMIF